MRKPPSKNLPVEGGLVTTTPGGSRIETRGTHVTVRSPDGSISLSGDTNETPRFAIVIEEEDGPVVIVPNRTVRTGLMPRLGRIAKLTRGS